MSSGRKRTLIAVGAGVVVAGVVTAVAATQFASPHKVKVVVSTGLQQQSGPGTFNGQIAPGANGDPNRFRGLGRRGLFSSSLTAAATYIGVTEQALATELASGKTLAQAAKAHGKSVDGLVSAMLAAEKKAIDATGIPQAQKDAIESALQQRLKDMVNGTRPAGPGFGGGFDRGGGRLGPGYDDGDGGDGGGLGGSGTFGGGATPGGGTGSFSGNTTPA